MMVSLSGFCLASFVPSSSLFFAHSLFTWFGQGIGAATELTTYPLILSSQYSEHQELATSIYQTFRIVGVCSSPFIGGLLFPALGYFGIFIFVAFLCSLKLSILQCYKAGQHRPQTKTKFPTGLPLVDSKLWWLLSTGISFTNLSNTLSQFSLGTEEGLLFWDWTSQ